MVPQIPTVFRSVPLVLMILAIKALFTSQGVFGHLVWPFEEWLVLHLLQNLMHWFSEYCINGLGVGRPRLSSKISLGPVFIESVRLEIPPPLRDNLSLSFTQLLIFLNPFILVNTVHKLAQAGGWFFC